MTHISLQYLLLNAYIYIHSIDVFQDATKAINDMHGKE